MRAPNRLGSVLNYFGEAYRFAVKADSLPNRRIMPVFLDAIGERERYGTRETVDVAAAVRLALTSAWVYTGIRLIADRVASKEARPQVKRILGERMEDIDNHPFEQLMRMPNSMMTADFMQRYVTWSAYLYGNAYIFISTIAPGVGVPEELYPLPSSMVFPMPETRHTSRLTGKPCINYKYMINGKEFILPGENMVHIRFPNVFDYWRGLSPLTAALGELRIDENQKRQMISLYGRDNAAPSMIISLPAEISNEDFVTAKDQIRDEFASGQRSAVIRAGDMTVQAVSHTMQQMDMINARKFNGDSLLRVIGVPEGMVTGSISGDSRLATEITFTRNAVQPFLDMIYAEYTANIAPYYPDENIAIVAPSIIPQDRSLAIQEYTTYSIDRTVNENRKILNLPPVKLPKKMKDEFGVGWLEDMCEYVVVRLLPYVQSNTFMAEQPPDYANLPAPNEVGDLAGNENGNGMVARDYARSLDSRMLVGPLLAKAHEFLAAGDMQNARKARIEIQKILKALPSSATIEGHVAELQRWKKVALKVAKKQEDPAGYDFTTEVLPATTVQAIRLQLTKADEETVRVLFDSVIADTRAQAPALTA